MKLWLDDIRNPAAFGCLGWHWVRTAQEAMAWFASDEEITEASLDHDLGWEATLGLESAELTGYDVVVFLEEHPTRWPVNGVKVHSSNPAGAKRMQVVIDAHYKKENQ